MQPIEFIEPFQRAFYRTKKVLFAPFDIGKWFVVGFTAWLSTLGQGGGSSGNIPTEFGDSEAMEGMNEVKNFLIENLAMIISVAVLVIIIILIISFVILWLSSRGRFMFLSNVAQDRSEVAAPWREFRREGNALFLWQIVFGLICLLGSILIIGLGLVIAWPAIQERTFNRFAVMALSISIPLFFVYAVVTNYIMHFLNQFVVPIMYKQRITTVPAWGRFMPLLKAHFWHFVLFGLFIFALNIGLGTLIMMVGFLTCCCGFLILAIPYINAVILLPFTVFFRFYSLEFLRQFGPEFDAFPEPPEWQKPEGEEPVQPTLEGPDEPGFRQDLKSFD